MKYELKEEYSEFWKSLLEFEINANDIIKTKSISKNELENWTNQVIEFVSENIVPNPKEIIEKFQYAHDERADMFFHMGNFKEKTEEEINRHRLNQFKFKLNEFKKLSGYLSVINSLNDNDKNTLIEVNSIKEKVRFHS